MWIALPQMTRFRGEQTLPDADDPGAVLLAGSAGRASLNHLGASEPAVRHAGTGETAGPRLLCRWLM